MKSVVKIKENIEILREELARLIQLKESLSDPEILNVSILLDKALDEYNQVLINRHSGNKAI